MSPTFQILIASVYTRHDQLCRLLNHLSRQCEPYRGAVTVLVDRDDCDSPVGQKRTRLLEAATGDYTAFVDDDDWVADDYVARIMLALDDQPDCVGFTLGYSENGWPRKLAVHSLRFDKWGENWLHYERTPNHLNPVRREIALQGLPFRDGFGEDQEWSDKIRPLLKTEVFLDSPPVYHYRWSSSGSLFSGGMKRLGYQPQMPRFPHVAEVDAIRVGG